MFHSKTISFFKTHIYIYIYILKERTIEKLSNLLGLLTVAEEERLVIEEESDKRADQVDHLARKSGYIPIHYYKKRCSFSLFNRTNIELYIQILKREKKGPLFHVWFFLVWFCFFVDEE